MHNPHNFLWQFQLLAPFFFWLKRPRLEVKQTKLAQSYMWLQRAMASKKASLISRSWLRLLLWDLVGPWHFLHSITIEGLYAMTKFSPTECQRKLHMQFSGLCIPVTQLQPSRLEQCPITIVFKLGYHWTGCVTKFRNHCFRRYWPNKMEGAWRTAWRRTSHQWEHSPLSIIWETSTSILPSPKARKETLTGLKGKPESTWMPGIPANAREIQRHQQSLACTHKHRAHSFLHDATLVY